MKKALILTSIILIGLLFLGGCISPDRNKPPTIPSINLPNEAMVDEEVKIAVRSVDPDRDEIVYRIDFGDRNEAWSDYHPSGQEVTFTHRYKEALSYGVRARAFDRKVASEWSEEKWIKVKSDISPPDHKTDRFYGMLYVCPWYSDHTGYSGLDQIKAIGFNTYHTWSPFQWEQESWWDGEEAKVELLRQVERMLQELKKRDMYGCLQMPLQDENLRRMAELMGRYDNAIAGTVEEPDLHIPPRPSLKEQKRIYDVIKSVSPDLQVWGCFNGGISKETLNPDAFDVIITDSYCYDAGSKPVPGTLAAQTGDVSVPWWTMNEWIVNVKIPRMLKTIPKGKGIINIQQGMYATSEGHKLPNMQEEWDLYSEAFGGLNSFAVYAHGAGQGGGIWIMDNNRNVPYSLQNQCRDLMEKLK